MHPGVAAFIVISFVLITDMVLIWLERKLSARMQARLGPMRVAFPENFHGYLQPVADAVKLMIKEDIIPARADRWVFTLAPLLIVIPAFMVYVTIPFSKGWIVEDLNIGLLYMVSVTSLGVLAIIMGGWASNNKYSILGAMRSAAQMVSYEVPLVLSIVTMVLLYGTLQMGRIVEQQTLPGLLWYFPVGLVAFLSFICAGTAELNRVPFDIPEGESELVSGYHTEYSGMKFAFFFLAEYANTFAISAIAATLFLGGWQGPVPDFIPEGFLQSLIHFFYFLAKTYFVIFLLMWFRWTFPRFRVDQFMHFGWKFMIPVTLANLFLAAILVALRGG